MDASERGSKHACPDCGIKYYDLNKPVVACPKCGAKPVDPNTVKSRKKGGRDAFRRYP